MFHSTVATPSPSRRSEVDVSSSNFVWSMIWARSLGAVRGNKRHFEKS